MKLKYKKMVFIVSMCAMGIGMVTFTMKGEAEKQTADAKKSDISVYEEQLADILTSNIQAELLPEENKTTVQAADTGTVSEVIAVSPLEKDAYDEINNLIEKYYKAKLKNDIEAFKPLVNDTDYINVKDNERKGKYVEDYKNISCYTRKGLVEGSFVVYVYHEMKFTGIKTLAPGMDRFYVKTNNNGKPYIYFGDIDDKTERYLKEADESEEVMELVYKVNEKYRKAAADDSVLNEFKLKLEESAQNVTKY